MYTQIILCLALMAMASARPQYHGYAGAYDHYGAHPAPVHDTPEVAHAKAAHFAAVAAAARAASHDGSDVDHSGAYVHDPTGDHAPVYVHDPRGDYAPAYNHYSKAGAYGGYSVAYHGGHYGATAVSGSYPYIAAPHVLHVPAQDTPEITAAKAAHFAAHAAAKGHHYG